MKQPLLGLEIAYWSAQGCFCHWGCGTAAIWCMLAVSLSSRWLYYMHMSLCVHTHTRELLGGLLLNRVSAERQIVLLSALSPFPDTSEFKLCVSKRKKECNLSELKNILKGECLFLISRFFLFWHLCARQILSTYIFLVVGFYQYNLLKWTRSFFFKDTCTFRRRVLVLGGCLVFK